MGLSNKSSIKKLCKEIEDQLFPPYQAVINLKHDWGAIIIEYELNLDYHFQIYRCNNCGTEGMKYIYRNLAIVPVAYPFKSCEQAKMERAIK